ncbi:hypothetical protein [Streptomyces caatingaensis]|uniref:Uncharacterized protein n=1 Tax=Streptomyces caatingaensis TaxID=1678637 RepID=A0A0K9XE85_9ACTN|nr:hypothetical protein [Streptomyces caatingaensis]KNB51675.1 hypothetical protein AC230_15165 [Streptomyces caatingaensis]
MYEPIRTKSVHTMADPTGPAAAHGPTRSREQELDIRLAGHLTALLTVTDELRVLTPSPDLDDAARRLAARITHLRGGDAPLRAVPTVVVTDPSRIRALHQRAHMLAGQALVVASSRDDPESTTLASARLHAHEAARTA